MKSRPLVFDYTDYRAYLKAYYDWQKANGFFSNRVFSERAGLKSRSYLRLVLAGKRNLTPESITKFIAGLGIGHNEADAFTALVHFNQATQLESRKHYWEVFAKIRPKGTKIQRVHNVYAYLTRMTYPVLLILIRQPHIAQDTPSLAQMTGMTHAQVEEAIETFCSLGVIVRETNGKYKVTCAGFETGDDISSMAVPVFHQNMLKLAQEKTELPQNEREFQSVMMPLNQEEFEFIKSRIRDLAIEFDEKFGTGQRPKSERMYALNMNLIPLTPAFIRDEKNHASQKTDEVEIMKMKETFP